MLLVSLAHNLSTSLHVHTLRFDFTGSGHSSGSWKFANYQQDYHDLSKIVKFVEQQLGCKVACIIGHSQGSAAVIKYASDHDDIAEKKCYVNLAGRYTVPNDFNPRAVFTRDQILQLDNDGMFRVERTSNLGEKVVIVKKDDITNRNNYDISTAAEAIQYSRVLTIHGDSDSKVPVENAFKFDLVIRNHTLRIIEGADHNFNGLRFVKSIVSMITDFLKQE